VPLWGEAKTTAMLCAAGRRSLKGALKVGCSPALMAPRLLQRRPPVMIHAVSPRRNKVVGAEACKAPAAMLFGADPTGYRARSSAGEHYLDMVGVTGSIPVAPTISFNGLAR
jgi:hypothetical protein